MTQLRILQLANFEAMDLWDIARAKAEAFPDDEILKKNEERAWNEAQEIEKMLLEEERKNGINI